MTTHELQRALSSGPFTAMLDWLAEDELVKPAFHGVADAKGDDIQQLLLRYFQYIRNPTLFGKPSFGQNGLDTMKHYNRVMSEGD